LVAKINDFTVKQQLAAEKKELERKTHAFEQETISIFDRKLKEQEVKS
jgi:hypothetical protein